MQLFGTPPVLSVDVSRGQEFFIVDWQTDGPPPNHNFETFLLSVWLPVDGGSLQLGVKWIAGESPVMFAFDTRKARQVNSPDATGALQWNATWIRGHFPLEWVEDVAPAAPFRATANRNGVDEAEVHEGRVED